MRASVVAFVAVFVVGACLVLAGCSRQGADGRAEAQGQSPTVASSASQAGTTENADAGQTRKSESVDAELAERLKALCVGAGGEVGVAVTHVESDRGVEIQGAKPLALYSVFKLPLAVAVLKDVEENRLRLDEKVRVAPEEIAPGWKGNGDLWGKTSERTVEELLELSLVRSDNTSSDKLLQLVGGPSTVTARMRALGLQNIDIHSSVREFAARRENPNTGTASDLARLLARLQKGEVLQPPQLAVLFGFMGRALTGEHRLRGDLPAGTPVADKTGTGEPGTSTNDVGLITLPNERGHLAMAVLISGSKLPAAEQEKLIARLARAAYDAHVR